MRPGSLITMTPSLVHQTAAAETNPHCDIALVRALRVLLVGRVSVLGIGNRDRGDDGAGSIAAERLASQTQATVLDTGVVPENFLEKAARSEPDTILLIDTVDFGGAKGELRLISPELIAPAGLSTHAVSLRMAARFLEARTGARIGLLAVQPAVVQAGIGLSVEVANALERLERILPAVLALAMRERSEKENHP